MKKAKHINSAGRALLSLPLLTIGFIAALASAPAAAQNVMGDVTNNTGVITQDRAVMFPSPLAGCLTVPPGISLCSDGKVVVPHGMNMSAAARRFVAEIKKVWPAACGLVERSK